MAEDRRKARRKTLLVEVYYEGAGTRAQTRISDISANGVFIETLSPLPDGSNIRLAFTPPGGRRIEVEGIVTQSQPGIGMGVAFTRIKPEDARLIEQIVSAS